MALTLSLGPDLGEISTARRWVADRLSEHGDETETAVLLVSELVTNAFIHAGTGIVLTISYGDHCVRIEIHDHSDRLPVSQDLPADATSGRGLKLVQILADDWGILEVPGDGKTLWFVLSSPQNPLPDSNWTGLGDLPGDRSNGVG